MYLKRSYLAPSLLHLLELLFRHILPQFPYDTKQEYGDPTIIVLKYTSPEYFPSNVNTFLQIALEQNPLYLPFSEVLSLHRLMVAYSQTRLQISMALRLLHFGLNVRPYAHRRQF